MLCLSDTPPFSEALRSCVIGREEELKVGGINDLLSILDLDDLAKIRPGVILSVCYNELLNRIVLLNPPIGIRASGQPADKEEVGFTTGF